MNTKRSANRVLMNHWVQAWTTLGRWQELNARLSREIAAPTIGWPLRSAGSFARNAITGSASAKG